MAYLTIGELAKAAQISKVAIRYYERCGLLPKAARRASGYRQYPQSVIARIRFIKNAKAVGFSLEEIAELLALQQNPDATSQDIRNRTLAKWKISQEKLLTLQRIVLLLEHMLLMCDGKVPKEQCPILETLAGEEIHVCHLLNTEELLK